MKEKPTPNTPCVTGITVPKNFAKESMQTNMKKPVADKKTILTKGDFFVSIMLFFFVNI